MERKLVFSKSGNIYLDTCMTQSAFSKSRLSLRLTENGFIATKNENGWSFSNWFFTGSKLKEEGSEQDSVLLEGSGFSGLTLLDFFETQDNTRQYFASTLVCSAIESAIEQNVPLYAIGAGGIIISSEFERIIFIPFGLYETASQCAGTEVYALSEGMYINKNLKKAAALRFTQAAITYKVLTGNLPFTQQDEELREEDYKDHNYIPVSQKVWSLNQKLAQAVDRALQAEPSEKRGSSEKYNSDRPFPIDDLYKELGITPEGHPAEVIRKTNISNEKFEEDVRKKQKLFQKKLKIKRWMRHNKTGIGIFAIALAAVLAIVGTIVQSMMQQPTTKGLTSFETVEMFYSAVNNTDTASVKSCAKCKSADNLVDMLSTIYVASKTRSAYNFKEKTVSPAEWFQFNYDGSYTMYGLTQFSIGTEKGSLFYTAPTRNSFPKSITEENPDIKNKDTQNLTVSYYLAYNEGDGSLFAEEKEDRITLTFLNDRWIITNILQNTVKSNKIDYKAFVEEYKNAMNAEGSDILKAAKELRKKYAWIPTNSELLEADNKIKAQNDSFN
ncbi:MAG: hypothetical protein K6G00_10745 [Treponema sp.]|nr:hypothetical protein [Treponema sp.]